MFVFQFYPLALQHKVLFNMDKTKALESINEIKDLMERSTKFVSLSGVTGILVGAYSLIGAWLVHRFLTNPHPGSLRLIILTAICVLTASILTASLVSYFKLRKTNQKLFNKLTIRVAWSFFLPLLVGGLFCIALLVHANYVLISGVMLLFYGLSLVNVSKYTFSNVAWLGYAFLLLGVLDVFFDGNGVLFWTIGFGLLHIIYGALFYFLWER